MGIPWGMGGGGVIIGEGARLGSWKRKPKVDPAHSSTAQLYPCVQTTCSSSVAPDPHPAECKTAPPWPSGASGCAHWQWAWCKGPGSQLGAMWTGHLQVPGEGGPEQGPLKHKLRARASFPRSAMVVARGTSAVGAFPAPAKRERHRHTPAF